MSRRSQLAALLFVAALVASPIVGSISLVGSAAAAPDGFVGVPDTNVEEDLPVGTNTSISAADLEGSVMASQNASSLQIVLTTPDRAEEYVGSAVGGGGGGIALVFQDDKAHAGREVAVPADAIRESVGHIPKVVHGVHEDGSSWTSDVTARNGLLIFKIPKFSANSVTFDADVSIDATATDGTSLSYDLGSMDSATDPLLNITGVESTESETVSRTLSDGESLGVNNAGTEPASATVTLEGRESTVSQSASGLSDGSTVDVGGNVGPTSATVSMTGSYSEDSIDRYGTAGKSGSSESIAIDGQLDPEVSLDLSNPSPKSVTHTNAWNVDGYDSPASKTVSSPETVSAVTLEMAYDPYETSGGTAEVFVDGTSMGTVNVDNEAEGYESYTFDAATVETDGSATIEVQMGDSVFVGGGSIYSYKSDIVLSSPLPSSVSISGDGGSASLSPTGSTSLDFSADATQSVSITTDNGEVDYAVTGSDRFGVADPSLTVDGTTVSHSGVLDGTVTQSVDLSLGSHPVSVDSLGSGLDDASIEWTETTRTESPSATIAGETISHSGYLEDGETISQSVDLSTGSQTVDVSTAGGTVGVSTQWTERVLPEDVGIGLNTDGGGGEWVNLSRTLNGGETISRTLSKSTLQEGTNTLTVSLGDGSLSADAPVPKIDISYMHASSVSIDTSYVADGWQESYNVSHTFAGSRENPTVTVPFSSRVYRIPQVEMSVNGGVWENVSASKWSLENGTELTVQLTDHDDTAGVEAGDTIAVRTTGYKVDATNGQIRVVDPTAPDDPSVDAGFVVESRESGFRINVGGTENAQKVHYLYEEGWTNPADEAVISADGGQSLWVPHATEGAAARVTTIPLEPALDAGDVGVQVIDPDEPTFKVTPGKAGVGDAVTWRWYSTTSGERYGLRSLSRGRFVDKSEAGPQYVSLTGDDSGETMAIQKPDGSSTVPEVGDVPGVGGGVWSDPTEGVSIQEIGIVAGWAAFVVLLVAATGRSSIRGRQRWILVGALGGGTALLALEVIRPGVVSSALSGGLREVVPLAGLAAIALVGYSVYSWWEKRKAQASTPETKVSFNLRDQK